MNPSILNKYVGFTVCAVVILLSSFLFLFQLGTKPFWDYDEAIYANVIHDTLQNGDLLTLHRNGEPWLQKPPLVFWTSMAIDTVFHHPEFSYRLTAALAGIASVVLVMLIVYQVGGGLIATVIAGFALATTGPFLMAGRELRLDVPAVAMILLTVYSFIRAQRDPWWFVGVGVGLALGFMSKNVIGLLSLLFILFWTVVTQDISWLKKPGTRIAVVASVALLIPWHLYEHIQYGAIFWHTYIIEILQHAGSDTLGGSASVGHFISYFCTHAAPWSILFPLSLIWLVTRYKERSSPEIRTILIFACTTLTIFAVFLISRTKINMYLQPVYPFAAMTVGLCTGYICNRTESALFRRVMLVVGVVLAGAALWIAMVYGYHMNSQDAANDRLVGEEKAVAEVILTQQTSLDLYAYNYDYYDTIEYYTARREIKQPDTSMSLAKPFLMIAQKPFMDAYPFPANMTAHFSILYMGQLLILYKFTP